MIEVKKRLGVADKETRRGGRQSQDVAATNWRVAAAAKNPSLRAKTNEIRSLTALTRFNTRDGSQHCSKSCLCSRPGVCSLGPAHFIRLLAAYMLQLCLIMRDEF